MVQHLLDGDFAAQSFQVGANAGDTIPIAAIGSNYGRQLSYLLQVSTAATAARRFGLLMVLFQTSTPRAPRWVLTKTALNQLLPVCRRRLRT